MIRTLIPLIAALLLAHSADAQIIRRPLPSAPRPVGVIAPPALPIPGSLTPPGYTPPRPRLRPYLTPNPYFSDWGFVPYWPTWYDSDPLVVNNNIPEPGSTLPAPTPVAPAPPELRARLTLTAPNGAQAWLNGTEVNVSVTPLILQSPILESGQSFTFNLKVTWQPDDGAPVQERERSVKVVAGENKSLSYYR